MFHTLSFLTLMVFKAHDYYDRSSHCATKIMVEFTQKCQACQLLQLPQGYTSWNSMLPSKQIQIMVQCSADTLWLHRATIAHVASYYVMIMVDSNHTSSTSVQNKFILSPSDSSPTGNKELMTSGYNYWDMTAWTASVTEVLCLVAVSWYFYCYQ
jgi:hypothetical protein